MRTIAVLIPSRDRPSRFEAAAESIFRTAARPERVSIIARLDADDERLPFYDTFISGFEDGVIIVALGERLPIPLALNAIAATRPAEIIGTAADDVLFRTAGWDVAVEAAIGDGRPGIAVPMDGREERKGLRCTHFFANAPWIERVGHLLHPEYEHFWADTHVADIATRAGRLVWLRDVLVEHLHPNVGKAARDETYMVKRRGPKGARMSDRDAARYEGLALDREAAADRVRSGADG